MTSPAARSRVSVVVGTHGRLAGLQALIDALRYQDFRDFELCVVAGPSHDGTLDWLRELEGANDIKLASCPEPNVSRSRNIGIAMAAGDLVAFIDDDAIPEPTWLSRLTACFADAAVAGAGGRVFEPDGFRLQFRFSYCDRFGNADHTPDAPADDGAFPYSARFPHVMGTNCMFRRRALVDAGGFDEEYDYYLDEADLCCRLVDAGFAIRQNQDAVVHHKFLAGAVRDRAGITVRHYPILKNQIYFALANGRGHASMGEILARSAAFIDRHRAEIGGHAREGRVHPLASREFEEAAERAWETGLLRGLSGRRRCVDEGFFSHPPAFLAFPPVADRGADGAVVFVLPGQERDGDLHQATLARARETARQGRVVRVFELLESASRPQSVDFIGGIWLHRIQQNSHARAQISARSHAVSAEIERMAGFCPVDRIIDAA